MSNSLRLLPRQQNRIELLAEIKLARRLAGEALVVADRALAKKYDSELARVAEDLRGCLSRMDTLLEGKNGMGAFWIPLLVWGGGLALAALFGKDIIDKLLGKTSSNEEGTGFSIDRGVKIATGLTLVGIGVYAVTR